MKPYMKRATALLLAFSLALTPAAFASDALGHELYNYPTTLGAGTVVTTGKFWSDSKSDLRTERFLTYAPSSAVTPVVVYGSTLMQKGTLGKMAKDLEGYGSRVLAGANGDFYVMATGVPIGMVVTAGILRSSSSYNYAVGYRADGTAFVGQPNLSLIATVGGQTLPIIDLNKTRTEAGYYLFTNDFGPNTQNSKPGVDVVLRPLTTSLELATAEAAREQRRAEEAAAALLAQQEVETAAALALGDPAPVFEPAAPFVPTVVVPTESVALNTAPGVGKQVSYIVEQVVNSEKNLSIPLGRVVLSVNASADPQKVAALSALVPGDTMHLSITSPDTRWNDAVSAMGGIAQIVTDGKVTVKGDDGQMPRTALGVKADGSTVLYTIDGRQAGYSVGGTTAQTAQRLIELGCVAALGLDGGGSTTFGTTAAVEHNFTVNNVPSDGAQRAVTNALFFVSNLKPSGVTGSLALTPHSGLLLAGATLPLKPTAIDTGYYPMGAAAGVTYSATGGTVSPEGVFTAGAASGRAIVTVQLNGATGTGEYTVVSTPTNISVKDEATGGNVTSLNFDPKGTVNLAATATYYTMSLTAQDSSFTWGVTPGLGIIDANGLFTAGDKGGSGAITVTAGSNTLSIPVTVASHILTLEDFEGDLSTLLGSDTVLVSAEHGEAHVRYGKTSLRLAYQSAGAQGAVLPLSRTFAPGEDHLSLWIYGENAPHTLSATMIDGTGAPTEVTLAALDFAGWRQITIPLPLGASALTALTIRGAEGGDNAGTLWLDQITTANEPITDGDPPTVKVTVSGGTVTATVSDNVDRTLAQKNVSLTWDGTALPFVWNEKTRTLSATLPALSPTLHRATVTATDASGNIGRGSCDLPPDGTAVNPFIDTTGHWAEPYTAFLWARGISNGVSTDAGINFHPDKNITRGEFFLMMARSLGIDPNQYTDVVLPFVDAATIPAWALGGVKTMYALGVLAGSAESDGLYVHAEGTLTRAESMTILGRIQPRGYRVGTVTYTDEASIPLWARDHIQSLTAQGVVSGYGGALRPADPVKRGEIAKLLFTLT